MEGIQNTGNIGFFLNRNPFKNILPDGRKYISTFNTDYVLIKSKNFSKAIELLSKTGYRVAE